MSLLGHTGLIIGSTAMGHHLADAREPKDLDVFTPGAREWRTDDPFWHPSFESWITPGTDRFATLDELYTIKVSHAYWELKNGSWDKHMSDVVFLKDNGAQLMPDLHKLLYKVWEETHGKKRVDLNMEADSFFADAVRRKYDHDSIHDSVAYGDQPMYVQILKDGHTVAVDMNKLHALTFEDKVKLFREEVYATALERLMVPTNYRHSARHAYAWALRRTITSLTKGWSAQFLVEHYRLFRQPDCDYVARHRANSHKLIPLEGGTAVDHC